MFGGWGGDKVSTQGKGKRVRTRIGMQNDKMIGLKIIKKIKGIGYLFSK